MPWFSSRQVDELLRGLAEVRGELRAIRERLDRLEDADDVRTELDEKQLEVERLSAQGLHVLGLLQDARAEISRLEHR
jgi:uncharacterized membrane protein